MTTPPSLPPTEAEMPSEPTDSTPREDALRPAVEEGKATGSTAVQLVVWDIDESYLTPSPFGLEYAFLEVVFTW